MVAEVAIQRNVDSVQLDLVTPFNKQQRAAPQHHILVDWIKNQELREADAALAQARLGLMEFMAAQADAAATAGRAGGGRISGSNITIVDVPRLARKETPGAATLALLGGGLGDPVNTSILGQALERSSSGQGPAGGAATDSTASSPAARSNGGEAGVPQSGSDEQSLGPGRPPGTAESASSDTSDAVEAPHLLFQHLQHFNGCVAALQQHLGPNFGVYFNVTQAVCPVKGRCAYVRLMRHQYPAKLATSVTQGNAGETKALLKPHRTVRFSRAPSANELATAAASAAIASSSRATSQSALRPSLRTAAGTAGGHEPPPPGTAAAILGEDNVTPVTLIDVIYSGITDAILRAEQSVAVVGNDLARLFDRYEPPLSLVEEPKHCRKLKTLPVAREYVETNRKIQQLNAVLFKLAKAVAKTAWIYSTPLSMPDGSLGDVAHMVCEAIRRVADTTWTMCRRHLDSVHIVTLLTHHEPFTITPRLINDETTFRFELDVVVDQSLLMSKTFPDCLPPMIRAVWDSLLALAAVVQESRTSLAPLRPQYQKLHEEVREFYTLGPEAAKAHKLGIVEAASVMRIINNSLAAIYEAEQVFETYSRNVQRIVDAYSRAQTEIKADLQLKLAELTTKLPRSIVKPSFSPEMLALMRSSVNPTELAASMTLALTANNMDRTTLTVMSDTLALGAIAAQAQAEAQVQGGGTVGRQQYGAQGGNAAGAGGGAVAALGGIGMLQQQQALQMQMQQAAAAAAAYSMYNMQAPLQSTLSAPAAVPNGADAYPQNNAAQAPKPAADAPELAAHGTSADYAAQLAMAQAYGYAYNNPYAAYAAYGTGTLGSITMGTQKGSSHNLLAGAGANGTTTPAAAAASGSGGTAAVAPQAANLVGAYQSAGYDANTMAMLAQLGYGGFAVGSQQQALLQQQQQQQQAALAAQSALGQAGAGHRG
ncbi:hypothetical protein Vretimale_8267 [Volvox reticuliferus]|uniref:Uncharacterized protein n=1 Tax=Volvox reticuliferus TaxID=1737510 RepID=A0A8J4GB01_9CHLO|nr:hypothetical protein Vretifemale_11590 [Volvox reticuliferus]GIM03503.1 hypothetical protein Vretimale_8267 [Volvox reticuliferus]